MRIRLNCLECGHPMDLGDAYEDYQGEVRCWGCRTVLDVTLQEGRLKAMRKSCAAETPRSSAGRAESSETLSPASGAEPPAAVQETR
ncbi:MAG TPA: hypothetical protein VM425_07470 [Myxococcota bacterium]|nr:hypothetical protein [Myxococcota bacterium]